MSGFLLISDLTEWFECRSEDIIMCKSLEATPNQMIGGTAVGIIPTKSSYFGKCYYYACTFISWLEGPVTTGFPFTRPHCDDVSWSVSCCSHKSYYSFFALGTTCKLRGARDEYVSSALIELLLYSRQILHCCWTRFSQRTLYPNLIEILAKRRISFSGWRPRKMWIVM